MTKTYAMVLACAVSLLVPSGAHAQAQPAAPAANGEYKPHSGQAGKDVVWVPTPQALVDRMLDMAKVTPSDYLVDLGSGDGRTVISAAKRGVRAHGIEYNPEMVSFAKSQAQAEGVADTATFERSDIFKSDFSKASVVTLFLLPTLNERLRPTLLKMKAGTRVVSNSFDMGDWQPDDKIEAGVDCTNWCRAMLWVIPARVEGRWRLAGDTLDLKQNYQMLSGTLTRAGTSLPLSNARMNGTQIAFTAGGQRYIGEVKDRAIAGRIEKGAAWNATR